jgi:hypothetical protein
MKKIENKDAKIIKDTYDTFTYFADNASTDYKNARKFFAYDRNLSARELDLIILNYLHLYDTNLKYKTLEENTGMDSGLYELISIFERIRSMANAKEKLVDKLPIIHEIYLKYVG